MIKDVLVKKISEDNCLNLIKPIVKNYDCYLVGGCLRDLLNGELSCDRDLIVKSDFAREVSLKIAEETQGHFVVLDEVNRIFRVVMPDKTNYFDVSAMLEDDFEKDIFRRDLTINSLAYDVNNGELIDLCGALDDFENGILKTVNLQNFTDDPLRMLRVYRFVAKYNYSAAKEVTDFISNHLDLMDLPARERVHTEVMKLFEGEYSDSALLQMDSSGLLEKIFPVVKEIKKIPPNTHHHLNLFGHSVETVRQIQKHYNNSEPRVKNLLDSTELGNYSRKAFLKLSGFLHDIGKPETWTIDEETGRHRFIMHDDVGSKKVVDILKNLKFSKKQISYVQNMIKFHIYPASLVWQESIGSKARLKFYRKMYPFFADVIILSMSDRLSAMGVDVTCEMIIKNLSDLSVLMQECFEFDEQVASPKPFLSGKDVMKITGLPESKELGFYVKEVFNAQLDGVVSSKSEAVQFVEKSFENNKNK